MLVVHAGLSVITTLHNNQTLWKLFPIISGSQEEIQSKILFAGRVDSQVND